MPDQPYPHPEGGQAEAVPTCDETAVADGSDACRVVLPPNYDRRARPAIVGPVAPEREAPQTDAMPRKSVD